MSNDNRLELVNVFRENLINKVSSSVADLVTDELIKALSDFSVIKECRELVTYDDIDYRILKRYCACLTIDGKSEKTIEQYYRTMTKLFEAIQKHFTNMNVYDIRLFLAYEKERGVSNRTLENTRCHISAFFQWLTQEELIDKNPCLVIKPIRYIDKVKKPFSSVEIDALRNACKNSKERAIMELLLSSGIRVSELTQMNVEDIDFDTLTVHVKHGKGSKERITYINDIAKLYLKKYLSERKVDGEGLFYNKKSNRLNNGGVRHILNVVAERAGVENVHPHRFRRTFATGLASRGMKIQDVKVLLGHTNVNTTMEYVCLDEEKTHISYRQYII